MCWQNKAAVCSANWGRNSRVSTSATHETRRCRKVHCATRLMKMSTTSDWLIMGELHERICEKYGMSMAVKWNPNLTSAVFALPADPANTWWTNCPSGMGVAIDGCPCSEEWISFSPRTRTLHSASQGNQTECFKLYIACLAESVAFKRAFLLFFLRKHAFPEPAFCFSGSFFLRFLSWRPY